MDTLEKRKKKNEYQKRWAHKHPEAVRARNKRYRETHKDPAKRHEQNQRWVAKHRLTNNAYIAKWHKTPKGRLAIMRAHAARRQVPRVQFFLNRPFPGSHLHHLDYRIGIWIPSELHKSIHHNLKTGLGMVAINDAISNWLMER